MRVFREEEAVPYEGTVVALGNFDGLHVAHMQIIRNCIASVSYTHLDVYKRQ